MDHVVRTACYREFQDSQGYRDPVLKKRQPTCQTNQLKPNTVTTKWSVSGYGAYNDTSSVVEHLLGMSKLAPGSIPSTTKLVLKGFNTGKFT